MKKKILHIITRLIIGGVSAHLIQVYSHFNSEDSECVLLAGSNEKNDKEMICYNDLSVEYIQVKELKREINIFYDFIALIKIIKIIRELKPDIVHTHTAKAGMIGRLAAYICRVPVIVHTFHGLNFDSYFGRIKSRLSVISEKMLASLSTNLICLSESLKKQIINYHIAETSKLEVIPLGFDYQLDTKNQKSFRDLYQISADKIIVASIGRLAMIKNHELFIKIAKKVTEMNDNVQFLIIGDGERRSKLEALIKEYSLEEKVIITGFIEDITSYCHEIDIMLLTSLNEGTPVAIIEAMFYNILVLSTPVGGVPDIIQNEVNGFLFNQNEIDRVAYLIVDYSLHSEKYSIYKKNANEDYYKHFTSMAMYKKLEKIYGINS